MLTISFKMTIDPLDSFNCSIVFPKAIFTNPPQTPPAKVEPPKADTAKENAPTSPDPKDQTVAESIQQMTKSKPALPGDSDPTNTPISSIMKTNLTWANKDHTAQQLVKIAQQNNTSYILIGNDNTLDGIVSLSDIHGILSPYLRSNFVKWRRPLDLATLKIKARWIMTTPVHTAKQDDTIQNVMQQMTKKQINCIPITDKNNKVTGTITVFDILNNLLEKK